MPGCRLLQVQVQLPEDSITVTTVMLPSASVNIGNEHTTFGYFVRVLASVLKTTNEGANDHY